MSSFDSHTFVSPPISPVDPSVYSITAHPADLHTWDEDDEKLYDAIRHAGELDFAQARSELNWPAARLAYAFARLAGDGRIVDMSPESRDRASVWKTHCSAVRSLIDERGWLSTAQVVKVAKAMGVPSPQLVCEYLACLEAIDRIPGDRTFYGPQGRPFESQHVVKKVSKPLSVSELRFMEAVQSGHSTSSELAKQLNCSQQWVSVVAARLINRGYIASVKQPPRIFFHPTPESVPSVNEAVVTFELEGAGFHGGLRP